MLEFPPIRWYLTGFLVPEASARNEAASSGDEDEDYSAGDEPGGEDTPSSEPEAKHRPILPSSLGLSVLLPPAPTAGPDTVVVQLSWGEYVPVSTNDEVAALCAGAPCVRVVARSTTLPATAITPVPSRRRGPAQGVGMR